jgi:hypothetical protein
MLLKTGRVSEVGTEDISVRGAFGVWEQLAPTWDLVGGHKHYSVERESKPVPVWETKYTPLDDTEYTDRYRALLADRYKDNKKLWDKMLFEYKDRELILGCFCAKGKFCHRYLAAEFISRIATDLGISVILGGEINYDSFR